VTLVWLLGAVALLLILAGVQRARRLPASVLVIAHRGASGRAPENTLAALRLAHGLGTTWAEVDVQSTADGVLVLAHDDTWERTAGIGAAVRDLSWEATQRLDAGGWFAARFRGEPPPRLDQVLEWAAASGVHLDLEIKSPEHHPGIGPRIIEAVRRHGMAGRVLMTSFDAALVESLAAVAPDLEFGYLASEALERHHPGIRTYALHHAVVLGQPAYTAWLRERGARLLAWTVDDSRLARRLVACGVHGIVTNHPERFLGRLGSRY
jgi:glycerophosphoryl diester phosphodiesterase